VELVWSGVNVVENVFPFPVFSLHNFRMSILVTDPALSARYVPEEPRYWISSSLVSALALPVYNSSCSLQISVQACDSPFVFSRSLTMLIQFETHPHQMLLGRDWFFLFQDAMAGYSVSIGSG